MCDRHGAGRLNHPNEFGGGGNLEGPFRRVTGGGGGPAVHDRWFERVERLTGAIENLCALLERLEIHRLEVGPREGVEEKVADEREMKAAVT